MYLINSDDNGDTDCDDIFHNFASQISLLSESTIAFICLFTYILLKSSIKFNIHCFFESFVCK